MSLHDVYARRTPFEIAFGGTERADALAREVGEEAEARGADADEPRSFLTLGAVAAFLQEIGGDEAPPAAAHPYGALAFHGVHFARESCPLYLLSTHATRLLVEGVPDGMPVPPSPAGYLQLPQHLFWSGSSDGDPRPESVDGLFWTVGAGDLLQTLLVTGVHPGRTGLRVFPLPEAPLSDASRWLDVDARGDGSDFSTDVPGAGLDALYGLATAGEVLKLLARFFAYLEGLPEAGVRGDAGSATAEGPEPSVLAFTRVTLAA